MRPLLPAVSSGPEFMSFHDRSEVWLPAIREICARHGVPADALEHRPEGGNVIFLAGERHAIKLVAPLFAGEHLGERACLARVLGRLPVRTPRIEAEGEVEGWPYVVLERLPGVTLTGVWPSLDLGDRARLARSLGSLIAALHRLPTDGLEAIPIDWNELAAGQRRRCVERHRKMGAPEHLLAGIPELLAAAEPLFPPGAPMVLVHADVTDGNVLVEERGGRWELSGLIDFGDAMIAHPDYDLVSTAEFLLCGRPALLRAFLQGYGLSEDALDEALSRRLMAITMLHRFATLPRLIEKVGRPEPYATLDEVTRAAWSLRLAFRRSSHL